MRGCAKSPEGGAALLNLAITVLAAYAFSRLKFVGKTISFTFIMTSRLIPAIAVAIPIFVIINNLGLLDTYPALILAYLAFTLPLGVSPHHMSFPGTITLRPETYDAVLYDTVASLKSHGINHFLLVNGHGSNMASLDVASLKMRRELNVSVAFMFYMQLAADVIRAGAKTTLYGHACEVEASVGLYVAPHTVRQERVVGEVHPFAHAHIDIKAAYRLGYPFLFEEFTGNGALGDARLATVEFGRQIVETAIERSLEFLKTFVPSD